MLLPRSSGGSSTRRKGLLSSWSPLRFRNPTIISSAAAVSANAFNRPSARFHVACALCLQVLLLSCYQPVLAYITPSRWPPRRASSSSPSSSSSPFSPSPRWYSSGSRKGSSSSSSNGSSGRRPSSSPGSTASPLRRSAYYYNNLEKISSKNKPYTATTKPYNAGDALLPFSRAVSSNPPFPPPLVEFELTKGVAGSRKTQHAVTQAYQAGSSGEMQNVLFLVKVGSNAQEIRTRLEAQMGLSFKRHKMTNHFVARDFRGAPPPTAGVAAAAAAPPPPPPPAARAGGGKASYWVASFDAFVDCQLRAHASMAEKLKTRGANFEWKRDELLRLIREGKHGGFCLKDGAVADFVLLDEAQDLREEDMQIVSRLVESEQSRGGALRKVLVVGDVEQTVFSDVLTGRSKGHPMDLLSSWMPSVRVNTRRLDINYRCPHAHVAFNNLALPRNASMGDGPVKPSPEMTDLSARRRHKPYLFTYVQSSSTVANYDAYRTACRIAEMVLVLLKTMEGLTLRDIAITSRFVNVNLILLQLEDVLERALTEAGYAPADGSGCVHLFRTKVTDRKSINWEEAGARLVMGSLTAFKGKDWRAVILLDCTEGVLPSKSSVHTKKELVDRSLFNVGTTRSREVLLIGFDAKAPSRYLSHVQERLHEGAQLEWDLQTIEPQGPYLGIHGTRGNDTKTKADGIVEWKEGRNKTVDVPFKYYWSVTDSTDEISTVDDLLMGQGLGEEGAESAYGWKGFDRFGTRVVPPPWFKTDETGRLITGVMGEALLARELHVRGLLSKRADATLLWPVVEKLGGGRGRKGEREGPVVFTEDPKVLNLAVDYRLNELWAYEEVDEWRQALEMLLEDHGGKSGKIDKSHVFLAELLEGPPKCVLNAAYRGPIKTFGPLLDYSIPSAELPVEAVWNCAILYQDALCHGLRQPSLAKRLLKVSDPRTPRGLADLLGGLSENVILYIDFKRERNSTSFSQGKGVALLQKETDEAELVKRGFCRERDAHVFADGWTYGLMGRIDFYDENRKRIVEVKVSDIDGILPSHEVQTLLYALLYGNGWKPTRAFEVVNLMKGVRYKRVVRKEVKLWECLKKGLEKLEFDEEMIETLGRMYGPQIWEKKREEEAAAAAVVAATVVAGEAEGKGEEGVQGEEGGDDEGDELEEHAALLLTGKPQ